MTPWVDCSALVVCHNEASSLRACLASLSFCREILVVDKGSTDDSAAVARAAGARVVTAPPDPPFVEPTRAEWIGHLHCEWVLFADPDEIFPAPLVTDLQRAIAAHPNLAVAGLPMRYFFRGRPLHVSYWGREVIHLPRLVHRGRVTLLPRIHRGVEVKPGFASVRIPATSENRIEHRWADSFAEVRAKHRRHLACEALERPRSLRAGLRGFWRSYITHRGWRGGVDGLGLSLLYAHYLYHIGGDMRR
ncbi:MAG TPA: glycosyltransferase [Kiritimatiellia bacterium]|nr:glycosyltransferase [Kiritimatiellia bacterium]